MNNTRDYALREASFKQLAQSIHVAALVKVTDFDPITMRVNVRPISQRLTDGEYAAPSQTMLVPVAVTRGGGFLYRPWYQPGDIGLVVYLDHDMDASLEKGDECKPNTERSHSDSDAVFIGGVVDGQHRAPSLPEGPALCTEDGSIHLVITKDKVVIQGDVAVQGTVTVTGGDVVADGISLKNHTHTGVTPGDESTGKPQ